MSTLSYLDREGNVNFWLVEWTTLNQWLSHLNGVEHIDANLPRGELNRGDVIQELENRRTKENRGKLRAIGKLVTRKDFGQGKDWREYENAQGYTHLEELLMFQPKDWRKQAREYLLIYGVDMSRKSSSSLRVVDLDLTKATGEQETIHLPLPTPIIVTLFHPSIPRVSRYEPLNFLLAYDVPNPLPSIRDGLGLNDETMKALKLHLSPLDYFFAFQRGAGAYNTKQLVTVGRAARTPRLPLIKELDFSNIVGQRLAKHIIRREIVTYFWSRCSGDKGGAPMCNPLSMVFAGPSGNGKTELAKQVAELLNRPEDSAFLKIDCAKLKTGNELFGMSGAYVGSSQGSALNNFVTRMADDPMKIGFVLLDELDKAQQDVITGLYQVLDKGEWTNKRLDKDGGSQTSVVSCRNIVFIMAVNAADSTIVEYAKAFPDVYTAEGGKLDEHHSRLNRMVRSDIQDSHPFTKAFTGRISTFVPFLPMSDGIQEEGTPLLKCEMMVIAKLLIEREQANLEVGKDESSLQVQNMLTPQIKHDMAHVIVKDSIPEAGVRSIQDSVKKKVSQRVMHACLLIEGGISNGSSIEFGVDNDKEVISFRSIGFGQAGVSDDPDDEGDIVKVEDTNLFG